MLSRLLHRCRFYKKRVASTTSGFLTEPFFSRNARCVFPPLTRLSSCWLEARPTPDVRRKFTAALFHVVPFVSSALAASALRMSALRSSATGASHSRCTFIVGQRVWKQQRSARARSPVIRSISAPETTALTTQIDSHFRTLSQ